MDFFFSNMKFWQLDYINMKDIAPILSKISNRNLEGSYKLQKKVDLSLSFIFFPLNCLNIASHELIIDLYADWTKNMENFIDNQMNAFTDEELMNLDYVEEFIDENIISEEICFLNQFKLTSIFTFKYINDAFIIGWSSISRIFNLSLSDFNNRLALLLKFDYLSNNSYLHESFLNLIKHDLNSCVWLLYHEKNIGDCSILEKKNYRFDAEITSNDIIKLLLSWLNAREQLLDKIIDGKSDIKDKFSLDNLQFIMLY